jgi:hypothetical protein
VRALFIGPNDIRKKNKTIQQYIQSITVQMKGLTKKSVTQVEKTTMGLRKMDNGKQLVQKGRA